MRRSKWKGNFIDNAIFKLKTKINKKEKKAKLKIWSRRSVIPKFLIGTTVMVHNGQEFKNLDIDLKKVGYKFGEFITTRKYTPKNK